MYENDDVVERIMRRLNLPHDDAEELFDDVKTFLWLKTVTDGPITPPPKIDDGWHEFLMFTEDYASFCQEYFGSFIHHRPNRKNDPLDDGSIMKRTAAAIEKYLPLLRSENWSFESNPACSAVPNGSNCSADCT